MNTAVRQSERETERGKKRGLLLMDVAVRE